MEINRQPPVGPVVAYQTFTIKSPSDRLIKYACEEIGCEQWRLGWTSLIDESTDQGKEQAAYIRTKSGRAFRERRTDAGITVFAFEPYQRCFREHQTRPMSFLTQYGDWRRNLGLIRSHIRPIDWVEDFAEHQDALATEFQRG